jgi:hypothetical protein
MESENVPASFEIAETRWPGVHFTTSIILAGNNVPAVEDTVMPGSTTV